jgi:hypothetical protein
MYNDLFNKSFLCKASGKVKNVRILAAIPSEYFSDEGFSAYAEAGGAQSPGASINNKNNYISFWVKDDVTSETFRVSEYEMLMETTNLSEGDVLFRKEEYESDLLTEERVEKYGELGFDKHFYKCRDVGMDEFDSYKSVIDLLKIKIDEYGKEESD